MLVENPAEDYRPIAIRMTREILKLTYVLEESRRSGDVEYRNSKNLTEAELLLYQKICNDFSEVMLFCSSKTSDKDLINPLFGNQIKFYQRMITTLDKKSLLEVPLGIFPLVLAHLILIGSSLRSLYGTYLCHGFATFVDRCVKKGRKLD